MEEGAEDSDCFARLLLEVIALLSTMTASNVPLEVDRDVTSSSSSSESGTSVTLDVDVRLRPRAGVALGRVLVEGFRVATFEAAGIVREQYSDSTMAVVLTGSLG